MDGADLFDPRADAVTLTTMHMAKGLEFPVVFIVGVNEGLIPYTAMNEDADREEERRLFYVSMTRAVNELFLIYARTRVLYGRRYAPLPSSYLGEIPAGLLEKTVIPDKQRKQTNSGGQMDFF